MTKELANKIQELFDAICDLHPEMYTNNKKQMRVYRAMHDLKAQIPKIKEPEHPELKPGDRVQFGRRSNITGRVVDAPDDEGNCMVRWDRTGSVEEENIRDLELVKTEEQ